MVKRQYTGQSDRRARQTIDPSEHLPNFFIAGTMRSGTTSLTRYLDVHPEVFIAPQKEIHFFDLNYSKGLDWYRRNFSTAEKEHAIGDATPSYMYLEDAVARMAQAVPDGRLIALLRHPVDRAYSHYWLRRSLGVEKVDFLDAVRAEPKRLALGDPRRECPYLDMSRYVHQLRRLSRYFPRESVHVVIFEELKQNPEIVYRDVCRFLGVDESFVPPNLGQVVNASVSYRWLALQRMRHKVPRPMWRVLGRLNTRRGSYPPLNPALRTELSQRFVEDNSELEAWLGRDLSIWSP
jgi:hypothetical protein